MFRRWVVGCIARFLALLQNSISISHVLAQHRDSSYLPATRRRFDAVSLLCFSFSSSFPFEEFLPQASAEDFGA